MHVRQTALSLLLSPNMLSAYAEIKRKYQKETSMSFSTRINEAFQGALKLPLTDKSKYVIFSDCHRGCGNTGDNFIKNEFLFLSALKHYYEKGFSYIELGDGDELWENRSFDSIKEMHPQSFEIMARFYNQDRFYAVYGNHDIVKKKADFTCLHFNKFYCETSLCHIPLFPGIKFYPGIILEDVFHKKDIYLTHGHQSDLLNSTFWVLSRFLGRYVWKPLEFIGIPDPTSAAKNNTRKTSSEQRLTDWADQNHHILITGHTHRPMAGSDTVPYFNTGSCVSPSGITCIEIEHRCITLVKWSIGTNAEQSMYVTRNTLSDTVCIDKYV